jgi:hypothetical protein
LSVTPKAFTVSGRGGVGVTDSSVMASPFVQAARLTETKRPILALSLGVRALPVY